MAGALDTGVLRAANNAQLDAASASLKASISTQEAAPVLIGLAAHVQRCWQEARSAKAFVLPRLLAAQLARSGRYSDSTLTQIREFGGSEEYARITANKCRVAEAWLRDVFLGQSEKPWSLAPTPKPDMTEDSVQSVRSQVAIEFAAAFATTGTPASTQETQSRTAELAKAEQERVKEVAREIADNMERTMYDQMVQGGWAVAMADFLGDMTTYPAAHFKAPVLRKRAGIQWINQGAAWQPEVQEQVAPEFERVDPFRIFPSPGAVSPQDGYVIEHISLSRGELYSLIGVEGFDEEAIRKVLEQYGRGGLTDWTNQSALSAKALANGEQFNTAGSANVSIDALEYHGPVQGRQLVEWGMSVTEITDPDEEYESCVWLIGTHVIKAQLNYDPLGRRPYYKTSYEELPGSYWGLGLTDILEDMQGIANAGVRSLVNSMAMCSGPQVGVNVDRLPPGEDLTKVHPFKIWQFNESQTGSNTKAVEFFQPQSNASEILSVIEKAYQFADDFSSIPRIMVGDASSGSVGRTASGMSMMLDAANKGLKGIVSNIDYKIMTPMLEALFNYNMLYNPDTSIKGDAKIVARGATSLMQLEALQLRRNEFLVATNNPTDTQILGLGGRAEILRESAKGLQMDVNRVVPPRGSFPAPGQGQQPPAQPGAPQQGVPSMGGGQELSNGSAVTDNFSQNSMTPQ